MTFQSFEEFWPFYVSQHAHPVCRALHVVGTTGVYALVVLAIALRNPWLLLLCPVVGYGMAWIGHFGFEKNKPAAFKSPWWSLRGDFRMHALVLTGKLPLDGRGAR